MQNILQAVDVSKAYRGRYILREVSGVFENGLTILSGPSGSGKSTFLRIAATVEKPSEGKILWNGNSIAKDLASFRRNLGYAPQSINVPDDFTASQFIHYISALKGLAAKSTAIEFERMAHLIGLEGASRQPVGTFSGGMKRRLILLQALIGSPSVVILDEPTAELDESSTKQVAQLIITYAESSIIIVSTHDTRAFEGMQSSKLVISSGKLRQVL